jgi:hypothetical protein
MPRPRAVESLVDADTFGEGDAVLVALAVAPSVAAALVSWSTGAGFAGAAAPAVDSSIQRTTLPSE